MDTIAVPAVLAAYNWAPNTDRYRKLATFVDNFFTKFPAFQNPPFHPKWKEVSLSAPLADWQRFPAAKQWLDQHNIAPVARVKFDEFLKQNARSRESRPPTPTRMPCSGSSRPGRPSRSPGAGPRRHNGSG